MPYRFMPKALKNGRGKIIYVARNPKDVLVSFYHFSKVSGNMEEIEDFDVFMEMFLAGRFVGDLWLDHIEGWVTQRDNMNILFILYEEMKKDLRSSVQKICNFLGKRLTEEELGDVVEMASFGKMSVDRRANYTTLPPEILDFSKGRFLRKVGGTLGLHCIVLSAALGMEPSDKYLFKHRGYYFIPGLTTPEYIDSLEDFEIRDNDVFLVTYPKSGTIWTQNILSLIYHEGHRNGTEDADLPDRVPWLEYNVRNRDYANHPSPRLFTTHLPHYLVPKGLRKGKAKIIYVARNPKDVLVSSYHFSKVSLKSEKVEDFEILMERFLTGKVIGNLWLDHIEDWSAQRSNLNILFLLYEEMKKDLRSSVLKICNFLGKRLTEEELDDVVDKASFGKMSVDRRANYTTVPSEILDFTKGCFLRKGTVGDWKNMMTVAQSERFDSIFKERMEKLPFKFCWDISEF
ncbi:amine sulfotransferase-like isoform X2 [Sceloporus undulatus]|nr:amine sulfotransferase-like isoform X2 [Sceloporus undulatus]